MSAGNGRGGRGNGGGPGTTKVAASWRLGFAQSQCDGHAAPANPGTTSPWTMPSRIPRSSCHHVCARFWIWLPQTKSFCRAGCKAAVGSVQPKGRRHPCPEQAFHSPTPKGSALLMAHCNCDTCAADKRSILGKNALKPACVTHCG